MRSITPKITHLHPKVCHLSSFTNHMGFYGPKRMAVENLHRLLATVYGKVVIIKILFFQEMSSVSGSYLLHSSPNSNGDFLL